MLNTSTASKPHHRLRQALIYMPLLIGVWLISEPLIAIGYILKENRSITLIYLYHGLLILGGLLFIAGLLLKLDKKRGAQIVFIMATIFSIIRWLKYWDFVFPFGSPSIHHYSTVLDFLWQTQHFAIVIVTLILTLLVHWVFTPTEN